MRKKVAMLKYLAIALDHLEHESAQGPGSDLSIVELMVKLGYDHGVTREEVDQLCFLLWDWLPGKEEEEVTL